MRYFVAHSAVGGSQRITLIVILNSFQDLADWQVGEGKRVRTMLVIQMDCFAKARNDTSAFHIGSPHPNLPRPGKGP